MKEKLILLLIVVSALIAPTTAQVVYKTEVAKVIIYANKVLYYKTSPCNTREIFEMHATVANNYKSIVNLDWVKLYNDGSLKSFDDTNKYINLTPVVIDSFIRPSNSTFLLWGHKFSHYETISVNKQAKKIEAKFVSEDFLEYFPSLHLFSIIFWVLMMMFNIIGNKRLQFKPLTEHYVSKMFFLSKAMGAFSLLLMGFHMAFTEITGLPKENVHYFLFITVAVLLSLRTMPKVSSVIWQDWRSFFLEFFILAIIMLYLFNGDENFSNVDVAYIVYLFVFIATLVIALKETEARKLSPQNMSA